MNTVDGYAMSSWERGYGDFVLVPDLGTLRRVPWQPATALVLADLAWEDGAPVVASPRQILRRQVERLAERGWLAMAGTELEFMRLPRTPTRRRARSATATSPRPTSTTSTTRSSAPPGSSRCCAGSATGWRGAGMYVESAKGECNLGQHEIAFRYADALDHLRQPRRSTRPGRRRSRRRQGMSITFMAKPNEREGNSCHIHLSLRLGRRRARCWPATARTGCRRLGEHFLAGQLAALRELTLCYAPNVNSYKRYQAGSFAPDRGARGAWTTGPARCGWSGTARRCGWRTGRRAATSTRYLAVAAMIAAGLHGIDSELPLEPAFAGNAYADDGRPAAATA